MSTPAQEAIKLPTVSASGQPVAQTFSFVSDGPIGPGWSRPDEIARTYFNETLPALFRRTLLLNRNIPLHGKLSWIFTGPHAGFTVELTGDKVRLVQRYYDSSALYTGQGNYPAKVIREDEQQFSGDVRTLTVIADSHLSVQVQVNGIALLTQSCVFDVTRHQLMFSAPRVEHLIVTGALLKPSMGESSIHVDEAKKHQIIFGFGGSTSIPTYAMLSEEGKRQYWNLLRHYNLLLDREYPMGSELKPDLSNLEDLHDATPHYYGDNFPNGEVSSFEYSKRALSLGGDVIYEMWALPPWATHSYVNPGKPILDAWEKPVRQAASPEEYARIVVNYCRLAKQHTGAAPTIVGIQNEVEQPQEVFDAMAIILRRELDKAGFQSVKIHMADASFLYMGVARANASHQSAEGWRAIDYTAAHEYDFQEYFANPDLYDDRLRAMHDASGNKPFLTTEICINDPHYQELSYRIAFNVGQLYQKNLTELESIGLMYCWLLLDVEQPSFGGSRSLIVPDKTRGYLPVASSFQLRVLGAFSRHVLKGMMRIDAASINPDLMTAAFEDANHASLIILNRSTEPQHLTLNWTGKHWVQIERTSPTQENATSATIPSELIIEPGEILTLSNFAVE